MSIIIMNSVPTINTTFQKTNWLKGDSQYTLDATSIDVWKINVFDSFYNIFRDYRFILNKQELERAKKYYWHNDFKKYLTGRIVLRLLLENYLNIPADSIEFSSYNKKPTIVSEKPIGYNLSYSDKYILIAISMSKIGIDIEKINLKFNYKNILYSCFAKEEADYVQNKAINKTENFFLQWTRKEAILKYTGQGIINDLSIVPSLDGSHTLKTDKLTLNENIHLNSFSADLDYISSLAYPTYISNIKYLEWQ